MTEPIEFRLGEISGKLDALVTLSKRLDHVEVRVTKLENWRYLAVGIVTGAVFLINKLLHL